MSIPTRDDILALLDQFAGHIADDLESEHLDFKPSHGPKEDLKVACEYAVCFANAGGGVVVFGVADKVKGRRGTMWMCSSVAFTTAHARASRPRCSS